MKKFMMNMPDDIHKRLKLYATECGTDMTSIVLEAIENRLPTKVYAKVIESPKETTEVVKVVVNAGPKKNVLKKKMKK
ncbi:MAG: hypothetical protein JXB23_12995 [Candidatus Aminicenantes bacterium]|nr:hypothetical protein [Candidatus Aminicenantes bacterium]